MRKLNKKASDQPGWISIGLILAIAVLALGLFLLLGPGKALLAKWRVLTGGSAESLSNIVLACDANCAQNDRVNFCRSQKISGLSEAQMTSLLGTDSDKYPQDLNSTLAKLSAQTEKDAKVAEYKKAGIITEKNCKNLENIGLAQTCVDITC